MERGRGEERGGGKGGKEKVAGGKRGRREHEGKGERKGKGEMCTLNINSYLISDRWIYVQLDRLDTCCQCILGLGSVADGI